MSWLKDLISKVIRVNGAEQNARRALHFRAGDGITISATDSDVAGENILTFSSGTTVPPSNLYVAGSSGNDLNPGTALSPFATLDKAISSLDDVSPVHIRITAASPSANGYSLTQMAKKLSRPRAAPLLITADVWTKVLPSSGTFTGAAYSATTVTVSETVTAEAGEAMWLRVVTSSNAALIGQKRQILRALSGTNQFVLVCGFSASPPGGTTYEIVRNAIVFDVDSAGGGKLLSIRGPEGRSLIDNSTTGNCVEFVGGRFFSSSGEGLVEWTGCVVGHGVAFENLGGAEWGGLQLSNWTGSLGHTYADTATSGLGNYVWEDLVGLGFAQITSYSANVPSCTNQHTLFDRSTSQFVCGFTGKLHVRHSFVRFRCGRIKGWSYGFTSGALHSEASMLWLGAPVLGEESGPVFLSVASPEASEAVFEGGGNDVQVLGPVTSLSTHSPRWLVRMSGTSLTLQGFAPTLPNTGKIHVVEEAYCRLIGVDGSTVGGGFETGYAEPDSQATFTAGQYIESLGAVVERTA